MNGPRPTQALNSVLSAAAEDICGVMRDAGLRIEPMPGVLTPTACCAIADAADDAIVLASAKMTPETRAELTAAAAALWQIGRLGDLLLEERLRGASDDELERFARLAFVSGATGQLVQSFRMKNRDSSEKAALFEAHAAKERLEARRRAARSGQVKAVAAKTSWHGWALQEARLILETRPAAAGWSARRWATLFHDELRSEAPDGQKLPQLDALYAQFLRWAKAGALESGSAAFAEHRRWSEGRDPQSERELSRGVR